VKPLPIAAGHPESDEPLSAEQEDHFETVALPDCRSVHRPSTGLLRPLANQRPGTPMDGEVDRRMNGRHPQNRLALWTRRVVVVHRTGKPVVQQPTRRTKEKKETKGKTGTLPTRSLDILSQLSWENQSVKEETTVDENESSPVQAGGVAVPDDELRRRGLTHDDIRFLTRILDVMNGDAPNHGLLDSMSAFKNDFDDLETCNGSSIKTCWRKDERAVGSTTPYSPAGRELLGQKLKVGPGQGDVGEKTPHKVGVKLLELWLDSRDDVAHRSKPYYEYDEETVFDVAGLDADGELVWVGEAELASNNKHAPVDDYDKQSAVDANAVWAFNRRETAVEVLDYLSEADRIESSVSGRAARSFSDIREAVESFDAAGLTTIRSFNKLDQELNT